MIILLVILVIILCFCLVVLVGAPYLPTLKPQIAAALSLAELKKGQTMLELGCGDGRVMVAAAEQGIKSVGYEINPFLVAIAWLRTRRYRSLTKVVWGNYWHKELPEADTIFVFLLDKYMEKLDKKCMQYKYKPVKLVSFAFKVPGKQPKRTQAGIYLYEYS